MAKYKLVEYEGHNESYTGKIVRQYEDGSLRDERGHFIERHPETKPITSENSHALARLRWEKYQQSAADAIQKAVGAYEPAINTPFAAWGVLNGRTAEAVYHSQKPRGRDLEYIGRNMGAIPQAYEKGNADDGESTNVLAGLGAEMVKYIMERAQKRDE